MMHLRQPIVIPASRPLRVIMHARFSTDEQRQTSLDDQIAVCRQFLDQSLPKGWSPKQVEIRDIREAKISGEIADRPGINEVWTAIESKRVDLIVAEESSRLYRHPTKAGELFEAAVDAGVRVICLSDYIDTADEDWPDRLHFADLPPLKRRHIQRENLWVVQPKGGHEMPRGKKFTAEQIIGKLREAEVELARGKTVLEVVRKLGVTEQTYYRWKREYGGLRTDQAKRLKDLEKENARRSGVRRLSMCVTRSAAMW